MNIDLMRILIVLMLLVGCGDNSVPVVADAPSPVDSPPDAFEVRTWGDAWTVWARAWCTLAARCEPEDYAATFPYGQHQCIVLVRGNNCIGASEHTCDEVYESDRLPALTQCEADMNNLACGVTVAPDSCFSAFW